MKNLICAAFSFKEGFSTSTQTGKTAGQETTITYLKNIFVTLTSAKLNNPDDDVILFSNVELPVEWSKKLAASGVETKICPFDRFVVSKEFMWALAYYKLCVLSHIVKDNEEKKEYDHILLMDTDTYSTKSYSELWKEADFGVLMYQVGHSFEHSDRDVIREDFVKFYPEEADSKAIIHFGGEFIAGKQVFLFQFVNTCHDVFEKVTNDSEGRKMNQRAGDETIWSISAALTNVPVIHAGAYIFRFWTGDFYLISTVTESNPVCIWHIPNEKEAGFIRLHDYYEKNGCFPTVWAVEKIMGISKPKRPFSISDILFRVKRKVCR